MKLKMASFLPLLKVSNIYYSLKFYKDVLAFDRVSPQSQLEAWHWAIVGDDNLELMLMETQGAGGSAQGINPRKDKNQPPILYFHPENIGDFYQHVKRLGCRVTPLELTYYGMREFSMHDPDGHMLSFGEGT